MGRMNSRPLRFWDLVLYTVAMTLSVRWLATAAAAGPAALPLWALAMLGFMAPLVIATAELTTRFTGEGGLYIWSRETFGPFAGFLCGWIYWTCNLPFFSGVLYFAVNALSLAIGGPLGDAMRTPMVFAATAIGITILIAGAHLLGLGAGKWLSNLGAISACGLLLSIIAAGTAIALRDGPATDFLKAPYAPPLNADGAILWSTMVFAFGGPEALAFLRNDVEGGTRQILRVLALVGGLLVFAYILGTTAMLSILDPRAISRLSGLPDALRLSLSRLGLGALAPAALVVLSAALLGGYSAWFGVAARLPFAAGVDHFLPRLFAKRDPRTGAPVTSIIVQTLAVIILVIVGQAGANLKAAYDFLVSMTVLSYTAPFLFLFAVYLKVQAKPAPAGAWTLPGGPGIGRIVGVVGLLVTASAILCTLAPSPDEQNKFTAIVKLVIASALLILSGVAAYALAASRAQRVGETR
jgi:amino acid transporter